VFDLFLFEQENTPKVLRWLPKLSFIRWTSEALAVNEFSGLKFDCSNARGPCCETGEQALERISFQKSTVKGANMAQVYISYTYLYIYSFIYIRARALL